MLLVLTDTGLRASEFCTLNVGDLNNLTGEVKINRGKGRKDRTVFIGPRTRRELARYLAERDDVTPAAPLWIKLHTGQRITYSGLRYILRKAAKRARVSGVSPHALRRTFAINSLRSGMPA
jgi:integrase/recombinase XerD